MKRIVEGVTYNTDTSTPLARSEWGDENEPIEGHVRATLYETAGRAYFVHNEIRRLIWNVHDEEHKERIQHQFIPLNAEQAHAWMMEGETEVFHNPFDDPPEATAEPEPGATIYLRVPASLKRRVDDAAKEEKMSGNVWAMRCVEQCLAGQQMPSWVLRDPAVHTSRKEKEPRVALKIAEGWPLASLTRSHAALLGRQLLKAVEETK